MESFKVVTQVDADGQLHLSLPQQFANQQVEIVLMLHSSADMPPTAPGYPTDYFARIDAIIADDVMDRGDEPPSAERAAFD
jgi:hypothetical protein